jgi:hypothetical protein
LKKGIERAEFAEKYINPFTDYGFKKLFGYSQGREAFTKRY